MISPGTRATRITRATRMHLADFERPHQPEPLEIVNPAADATYMIDPTLRAEFQTLPLRASGVRGGDVLLVRRWRRGRTLVQRRAVPLAARRRPPHHHRP